MKMPPRNWNDLPQLLEGDHAFAKFERLQRAASDCKKALAELLDASRALDIHDMPRGNTDPPDAIEDHAADILEAICFLTTHVDGLQEARANALFQAFIKEPEKT